MHFSICPAHLPLPSPFLFEVGKLNGRPVKVLRDTGCTGMIVDRALIPDSMVIPGSSGSLQMVDHTLINVPLANVYLDSPYYKGQSYVCQHTCISCDNW